MKIFRVNPKPNHAKRCFWPRCCCWRRVQCRWHRSGRARRRRGPLTCPPGALGDAFFAITTAFDVNIIADEQLIQGKTAPAVSGTITAKEALERALLGSGLSVRQSANAAFVVTRQVAQADAAPSGDIEAAPPATEEIVVTGTRGSYPLGVGRDAALGILGNGRWWTRLLA